MPFESTDPNLLTVAPAAEPVNSPTKLQWMRRSTVIFIGAVMLITLVTGQVVIMIFGVALAVAWGSFGTAILRVLHGRFWHEAQLTMPRHGIRLGESFAASFRQEAKKISAVEGAVMEAALVCVEWVRYSSGSRTVTKTSTVRRVELPVSPLADDRAVGGTFSVGVPFDLAPSFELRNNRLTWAIEVRVQSPKGSDPVHHFPFTVLAEYWDGDVHTAPPAPGGFRPPGPNRL